MIAISRFQVAGDDTEFRVGALAVVSRFAASRGCEAAELVQNLDEPGLWAIVSRWTEVGDYRRAFNGTEAKLVLMPLLGMAIDEPSAYADPGAVGVNLPRAR